MSKMILIEEATVKQALETLEWNMCYLPSHGRDTAMAINAITALREALAQPSKPWVGLTPDDIRGLCANTTPSTWDISLCRLVEKFLKEKNNA